MIYDLYRTFFQKNNCKSRVNAKIKTIENIGGRLLNDYPEAITVKTVHTRAAEFCGAIFANRGRDEVILVIMGGRSTTMRKDQMMKLCLAPIVSTIDFIRL